VVTFTAWTTDDEAAERAFGKAFDELRRFDRMMTDWKREGQPESDVVRINDAAGKRAVKVAPETLAVIKASIDMSRRSEGTFDMTFAAMRGLWKFDEDLEKKVPSKEDIEQRRKLINWKDIVVDA